MYAVPVHVVPAPRHTWELGERRSTTHAAGDSRGGACSLLPWAQRPRVRDAHPMRLPQCCPRRAGRCCLVVVVVIVVVVVVAVVVEVVVVVVVVVIVVVVVVAVLVVVVVVVVALVSGAAGKHVVCWRQG